MNNEYDVGTLSVIVQNHDAMLKELAATSKEIVAYASDTKAYLKQLTRLETDIHGIYDRINTNEKDIARIRANLDGIAENHRVAIEGIAASHKVSISSIRELLNRIDGRLSKVIYFSVMLGIATITGVFTLFSGALGHVG